MTIYARKNLQGTEPPSYLANLSIHIDAVPAERAGAVGKLLLDYLRDSDSKKSQIAFD